MVSSRSNSFVTINEMNETKKKGQIKVRVSRLWEVQNHRANNGLICVDMILIDEEGEYAHATINSDLAPTFLLDLIEGDVYVMNNFDIVPNKHVYRVHKFDFVPFGMLEQCRLKPAVLTGSILKSMDWKRKKSSSVLNPCGVNRLISLPVELVSRIASLLSFKDVAAMQVLCKTIRRDAFTWITSVDLDDAPVSYCQQSPQLPHRFPVFVIFVDHVLNNLSLSGHRLTRFRLRVGGDKLKHILAGPLHGCDAACFPHLEPFRFNAWISYPLALLGLRELDLSFHLRNPSDYHLPPQLFASQSLEVLKLDSNLHLDAAEFSHICLPALKLLHLHSFLILQDDFITKLVSCCPSLEELIVAYCLWSQGDRLAVCSHSLRRLELIIHKCDEVKNSGLVLIDTPNLQYFLFFDNLAFRYSITNMNDLVQADLAVEASLLNHSDESSVKVQLSLVRMLSNIHHLSLLDCFVETMYYGGDCKDQLPVFHNLKTLELGSNSCDARWDEVLLEILTSSPSLETLIFPQVNLIRSSSLAKILTNPFPSSSNDGDLREVFWSHISLVEVLGKRDIVDVAMWVCVVVWRTGDIWQVGFLDFINPKRDTSNPELLEIAVLEDQTWKTTNVTPKCFQSNLRRIVIEKYVGIQRELNIIKFLLRKASVLRDLVVGLSPKAFDLPGHDHMLFESTLKELPRASVTCSIRVSQPTIPAH
ncbi:hypothetical protein KSS87_022173 [Heliosperma pusillum]|nr:hypothetical protein KSS87_022173 [Heliosperma pusillum]